MKSFFLGFLILWFVGLSAVMVWLVRGDERQLQPDEAQHVYGKLRSSYSSSDDGVFAFARVLEQLGFELLRYEEPVPLPIGTAFVLSPDRYPSHEEKHFWREFLSAGGTLVLAPPVVRIGKKEGEKESEKENEKENEVAPADVPERILADFLGVKETEFTKRDGVAGETEQDVAMGHYNGGRWVVLNDGARSLSNKKIKEDGMHAITPWLTWAAGEHTRMIFNEWHLRTGRRPVLFSFLRKDPWRWVLWSVWLLIGMAFWLVVPRRIPARESA